MRMRTGQTSSGKTFTMMGSLEDRKQLGIIPNTVEYIFERISSFASVDSMTKYSVMASALEIYNEHVHDLLVKDVTASLEVPVLRI